MPASNASRLSSAPRSAKRPAGGAVLQTHGSDRNQRLHAALLEAQHGLACAELSDQALFELCAAAALGCTQAEGAGLVLHRDGALHCVALAGHGLHATDPHAAVAWQDSPHWPRLAAGESLRCGDTQAAAWPLAPGSDAALQRARMEVPLQRDRTVIGALQVWSARPGDFTEHDLARLEILALSVGARLRMREVTAQLQASHQQYEGLFQAHPQAMWVFAPDGDLRLLAANETMALRYGYSQAELLGMGLPELWSPAAREEARAALQRQCADPGGAPLIGRHQCKNGGLIDVEISIRPVVFNGAPAFQSMALDITERVAAERQIARMARAQHLVSACNEAMVRAATEGDMLQAVCRFIVELGGYQMAWVGMARDDERKSIECVAHAGESHDFLVSIEPSWDAHSLDGQGPAGAVVRSGEPVVVRDVRHAPQFARLDPQLAVRLRERGFRAMVCLPLRDGAAVFGVLSLYAPEVLDISGHEQQLLVELAADVSFGLLSLRLRQQQQRMQGLMVKIAASVTASTGTAFFVQLATNMAEALGAHAACVGRFLPSAHGGPERIATLALVMDGRLLENKEFPLDGTPSEQLATHTQYCVPRGLAAAYPHAPFVHRAGSEAYVGHQLADSAGTPMGLLFLMYRRPLEDAAFVQSTLQIFASRASAEIERQLADGHIRRQASLLDKARDAIIVRGLDHRITYWNQGAERLYGWTQAQALGRPIDTLLHMDAANFLRACEAMRQHGEWTGELTQRHRDGHPIDAEGRWTLVQGDDGQPDAILAINTDIRERKATQREIQRLAFYDALTGLPNRMLLMDRARHALANAARLHEGGALLFIDLDNFKTLNDTLGHDKGDLLLQQVARRLEACVRGSDTVARLGGDEFVVMLEALSGDPQALVLEVRVAAEKILSALAQPYQLESYHYRTTPSIGIAPFSHGNTTVGELLKQADLAMYQAKTSGRNTLRFFDPHMQAVVSARAALESDMRTALAKGEFLLHYQPQVRYDGELLGVEALARWQHPERGMVSPATFIPVAEETGLILTLGRWVLHTACYLLAGWQRQPRLRHLTMAVNVSSRQFRSPSFIEDVARVLAVTGAPAHRLKLELTESVLVDNVESTIATMEALRAIGVGFALDDFGTGYSSLSYLKRMPLHQLKIDQSFVRDLLNDPNDAAIVDTIVALSATLGLDVIAEGVETHEQREMLLQAGCLAFQGYLYSRPLTEEALGALLEAPNPPVLS